MDDPYFEAEQEKIEAIKESMKRCQEFTDNMLKVMSEFEEKLGHLESTILPIHKKTQRLTSAQKNITLTLWETDRAIVNYDVANETDEEANQRNISNNYSGYIQWVHRLNEATAFFKANSSFKDADRNLRKLERLMKKAMQDCQDEFGRLLTLACAPARLARSSEWLKTTLIIPEGWELIPIAEVAKLADIASAMASCGNFAFVDILKEQRAAALKGLLKRTQPAKGEAHAPSEEKKVGSYRKGQHRAILQLQLFFKLLEMESELFQTILSRAKPQREEEAKGGTKTPMTPFQEMVGFPIDYFIRKATDNWTKDKDGNKALILLDILDNLRDIPRRFSKLLGPNVQKLNDFFRLLVNFCRKALSDYRQYVLEYKPNSRVRSLATPKPTEDGTIFTLTIETLTFLKRLQEYQSTIDAIRATGDIDDFATHSIIISHILEALEENLKQKTKGYKKASLAGLFLLNNFHYIQKNVMKNKLEVGEEFARRYDVMIKEARKQYMDASWGKILTFLNIEELKPDIKKAESTGKTPKALRNKIKAKYTLFNTAFGKVHSKQVHYSVPDPDLRAQLRQDNAELIVDRYKEFNYWLKKVTFTKQVAKYDKYRDTLESMINQFFEDAQLEM